MGSNFMRERDLPGRVGASKATARKVPTVFDALSATERRRRDSAWNLRNHPDPDVAGREQAIADLLSEGVNGMLQRGREIGVDFRTIPVEGLVFPGTSLPQTRAFVPQARRPIEETENRGITPSIQELLRLPDDEALPLIKTSGTMVRFILGRTRKSQQYTADRLAKSKSWIDKVGRGERSLNLDDAFELCDILGLDRNHPYTNTLIGLMIEEAYNIATEKQKKRRAEVRVANPLRLREAPAI